MVAGSIISVAEGMRLTNARLLTAAMRDTREVWATFILPNDRAQIISLITKVENAAKDDEVQKNLIAFAATLAAAK